MDCHKLNGIVVYKLTSTPGLYEKTLSYNQLINQATNKQKHTLVGFYFDTSVRHGLFYLCAYTGCVCAHITIQVWTAEEDLWGSVLSSTAIWVWGIELR